MDSGIERYTRPTAAAVAAPDPTVPRPRTAPRAESAAPDLTPADTTVGTGPIPAVPAAPPVSRGALVETDPVGFAPVEPAGSPRTADAPAPAPVETGTIVTPPVQAPVTHPCRCGHDRDAHEHFRRGTDCAACGCARFRFRKPSRPDRLRG